MSRGGGGSNGGEDGGVTSVTATTFTELGPTCRILAMAARKELSLNESTDPTMMKLDVR